MAFNKTERRQLLITDKFIRYYKAELKIIYCLIEEVSK